MEKFLELREKALKNLKLAEQGINFTYSLVKDNKVMLGIVNCLFLSITNIIGSLLYYELKYKNIPPFEDNFESKMNIFRNKVMEKYHLDKNIIKIARELKEIIIYHNQSPIEFSRGDKFIICSNDYEMKEITISYLKEIYSKTKLFIEDIIYITNKS